ncbi:Dopey N-terminal domain-containing protein [Entamoeba marina]
MIRNSFNSKQRTFEEFISEDMVISTKQEVISFFTEINGFVNVIKPKQTQQTTRIRSATIFRANQSRTDLKQSDVTKKSLTDWLKANSGMIGEVLRSSVNEKSILQAALPVITFMGEVGVLKDGTLTQLLRESKDKSTLKDVGDIVIRTSDYLSHEEAEGIFKMLGKWNVFNDSTIPIYYQIINTLHAMKSKLVIKDKLNIIVQQCIEGCKSSTYSPIWMKGIKQILPFSSQHGLDNVINKLVKEITKGSGDKYINLKLLTYSIEIRGECTTVDKDFSAMQMIASYLSDSQITVSREVMVDSVLEYIKVYNEYSQLSIPSNILINVCILMTDALDLADELFKWINSFLVTENHVPSREILLALMSFMEGHISVIDTENGMILLQRVLIHYNQNIQKSINVNFGKIEVLDKSGNDLRGVHLMWEVAMGNSKLYLQIISFMAQLFYSVPSLVCTHVVDTFISMCTSTDTSFLAKTMILFVEKTKEIVIDQPSGNMVDVYLEEINNEAWRCEKFKANVQITSLKTEESFKEMILEQQRTLENFERSNKRVFISTLSVNNVGRFKKFLSKKLKNVMDTFRMKLPKSFDIIHLYEDDDLAGRIKVYCKGIELKDDENVVGNEIVVRLEEYHHINQCNNNEEIIKLFSCTNNHLAERLTEMIQSNNEIVAYSGWQILEALFDYIVEDTEIDSALSKICYETMNGGLLPPIALIVKCLNTDKGNVEVRVRRHFWKLLETTCSFLMDSNIQPSTIRGVIIEKLSQILWFVLLKQSDYRWCFEMKNLMTPEFLLSCKNHIEKWNGFSGFNSKTHHYTSILLHVFLYLGMIHLESTLFLTTFIEIVTTFNSNEECRDIFEMLYWFDSDKYISQNNKFCEKCFAIEKKLTYGYFNLVYHAINLYIPTESCNNSYKELCLTVIHSLKEYMSVSLETPEDIDGIVLLALAIVKKSPQYFDSFNIILRYTPFVNSYLLPLTTNKNSLEHFPRCTSLESRKNCFDLVLSIPNETKELPVALLTHLSQYFSLHTRQKEIIKPPVLKGPSYLLSILYQLSTLPFVDSFLLQSFNDNNNNIHTILHELQLIFTYILHMPICSYSVLNFEELIKKEIQTKKVFNFIEELCSLLQQHINIDINILNGNYKQVVSKIKENCKEIVIVKLDEEIKIPHPPMNSIEFEKDDNIIKYNLCGVVKKSSQFKYKGNLFCYEHHAISKIVHFDLEQDNLIFFYKKEKQGIDQKRRITFSFKNEVKLFEQTFQYFILQLSKQTADQFPSQTLLFILYYFDVVYLRLPMQPFVKEWSELLYKLYDNIQNKSMILEHFCSSTIIDGYARCRSLVIRTTIFEILKKYS